MHGRKKSDSHTSTELDARLKKVKIFSDTIKFLFYKRKCQDFSIDTLELTGKMLVNNPDVYSVWNYRREILLHLHHDLGLNEDCKVTISNEIGHIVRDQELFISSECIKRNPKSYCAWYHRLWIIRRFETNILQELRLCQEFLLSDQRNFHCWNYRRAIVSTYNVDPATEFKFAQSKIFENFSNYSAFHHRSIFLQSAKDSIVCGLDFIKSELSIVENAIFTEPDDQSSWWYLHFLLNWIKNEYSSDLVNISEIFSKQYDLVEELLSMEPNCKWALTCLVSLSDHLMGLVPEECDIERLRSKRIDVLYKLIEIDASHINRYKYLIKCS